MASLVVDSTVNAGSAPRLMPGWFRMDALAHRVALSSGWSRRAIATFSGATGALAMAPVGLLPAMIVPMTVAVWLIDGADQTVTTAKGHRFFWPSIRAAAAAGWWWGVGYFVAGLFWLGAACLVEPDQFAWALPIAVLGVPAILAVFSGLGFALARIFWMPGAGRILSLTLGLGLSEWLRGFVLTGFPWNEYGMAFGNHLVLAQSASVVGAEGLNWLAIAICAVPATLADRGDAYALEASTLRRVAPAALGLCALAALALYGGLRLSAGSPGIVPGVKLRIMQPNVTENSSFTYANRGKILGDYLALSDRATSPTTSGLADVTHLIWPESPFPFILSRDAEALDTITGALPAGTTLITGSARADGQPGTSSRVHYYNSIQVLTKDGGILDTYDKVHLVPFGEYLPLDGLLTRLGIHRFVTIPGGFTPGARHRLLAAPGLPPIVPAICYEAIFPGDVMPDLPGTLAPGMILNVTNDSWFGRTAGPYQHLSQARLRAIEQGLPLVRAGNTGISAIVDPYGRIVQQLPLGTADVLDGSLPKPIGRTPFATIHPYLPVLVPGLLFALIIAMRFRHSRLLYFAGAHRAALR